MCFILNQISHGPAEITSTIQRSNLIVGEKMQDCLFMILAQSYLFVFGGILFIFLGDGTGVSVYVIDTGILPTHVDFEGRAVAAYDATRNDNGVR